MPRLWSRLLLCLLLAAAVGCTEQAQPDTEPSPPPASETPTAAEAAGPVFGASHVLVPAPGGQGVVLVTGPPEGAVDTAPLTLWRWDGSAWSSVATEEPAPSARSFFAASLDTTRDVLVVFGGDAPDGISGETWEWDGRAWSLGRGPGPGARSAPSLTWDPGSGLSVLYGGNSDDGRIPDDTWGWDGRTWMRLARQGPDPGRWPAATVGGSHQLLLYGGHQVADEDLPGALADTWVWSGGSWAPEPGAGGPGALVNAHGLLHPRLGPLLVGGSDLDRATGDVWQWRGDRWTLLARDVFPARQGFGLAYDRARDRVILTGGVVTPGSPERHQDLWEWTGDPEEPAVLVDERPPA